MKTKIFNRGMTLVELLVVVSIMVVLVGLSVPLFKPMLESQRTAGGARVVAMALQRARIKAMEMKMPVGVEFERFDLSKVSDPNNTDGSQNACVRMHYVKNSNNFTSVADIPGLSPTIKEIRVSIVNGSIQFWVWDTNQGNKFVTTITPGDQTAISTYWKTVAYRGGRIQLNNLGWFPLASDTDLAAPFKDASGGINLPEPGGANAGTCLDFKLENLPRRILAAPVVMPRGTIVDLAFSGMGVPGNNDQIWSGREFGFFKNTGNRQARSYYNRVMVMFSPVGYIDSVYYGISDPSTGSVLRSGHVMPNELIYFLVGEWDRQTVDLNGNNLMEDGRNNLMTASNFWVTANPRTGEVRTAELGTVEAGDLSTWQAAGDATVFDASPNPPPVSKASHVRDMLPHVRKFATEHYINIGGF